MKTLLLSMLVLVAPVSEAGNHETAEQAMERGEKCLSDLDYECAERQLFEALRLLKPSKDPDYDKHLASVRLCLARLYVAMDELAKAEEQLVLLLAFEPDYEIDRENESPKLVYVFDRAKEKTKRQPRRKEDGTSNQRTRVERKRTGAGKEHEARESDDSKEREGRVAAGENKPAGGVAPKKDERSLERNRPPGEDGEPRIEPRGWRLSAGAGISYVQVFGKDADAVGPGFRVRLHGSLKGFHGALFGLEMYYERHDQKLIDSDMAFDVVGLAGRAGYLFDLGPLEVGAAASAGAQGMGHGKALEQFGFAGGIVALVSWTAREHFGVNLEAGPRLVAMPGAASVLLDIGLSASWVF